MSRIRVRYSSAVGSLPISAEVPAAGNRNDRAAHLVTAPGTGGEVVGYAPRLPCGRPPVALVAGRWERLRCPAGWRPRPWCARRTSDSTPAPLHCRGTTLPWG